MLRSADRVGRGDESRGRKIAFDRLMCVIGAYAEYIAVSTHMLIHKPKELSWEKAAGIPEVLLHRRKSWIDD